MCRAAPLGSGDNKLKLLKLGKNIKSVLFISSSDHIYSAVKLKSPMLFHLFYVFVWDQK